MIRILDEALKTSKAWPYLEMPDYVMDKCTVGKNSSGEDRKCGHI